MNKYRTYFCGAFIKNTKNNWDIFLNLINRIQMKNNVIRIAMLVVAMFIFVGANAQAKYIGADKCKVCHNKPAKGDQYNQWKASDHSKAFTALSSAKAKEIATKNGIADATKDAKCLACHSTKGSVAANLIATLTDADGVSCESCHGPGSLYKAPAVMKDLAMSKSKGLIVPGEATCKGCHTGNKMHDNAAFDYAKAYAKISHKDPTK